MIYIINGMLL